MEAILVGPTGRIVLGMAVLTIGRAPDNLLVVNDSRTSTHHAEIRLRGDGQGYSITDLGSTNGTFVNNERLDRNIARLLTTGDRIRIGEATFTYEARGFSQLAPTISSHPDQSGNPAYQSTVAAVPPASTAYGSQIQQEYLLSSPDYSPYEQVAGQPYGAVPPAPPPAPSYSPVSYAPYGPVAQPPYGSLQSYGPPSSVPPVPSYPPQPPQQQTSTGLRIALIAGAVFVVLGLAAGAFLLLQPHPHPLISVSSAYKVGATPAGASGTVLHVSSQQFSSNTAVTLLLDGTPVPGARSVQSDANGNVKVDLTVTDGWGIGNHTLTARDANNYTTQTGVAVVVVPPGQAHTPGPNGAPPDDMSFSLSVSIQRQNASTGEQLQTWNQTLLISGRPDPAGGTVCQSRDDGQSHTDRGDLGNGITYTDTYVWTCSGTYKGGKLSYNETVTSDKYDFSTGVSCTANTPYTYEHLDGSFIDHSTVSGTYAGDSLYLNCSNGKSFTLSDPRKGSWTGTFS